MRIIIMYDISMDNEEKVKKYNTFRKELFRLGYTMIQYSIYSKRLEAHTFYKKEKEKIISVIPRESNVRIMMLTEKQYQNIELLNGEKSLNEKYNNRERFIEI
ncbi:CRISPR-associated protein Cas2 [Mycoplasmopsis maculosa]|uniref:CRISPR-associated endoribonuclease Cas2 n=1 Tax=Mycoplasmopsis maculosa TaxID=114885 RepID=A0A449B4R1_9BACT|nr:CRISPR-associated endonuclease Cas2 [Mycoplasmopsis maculosa]VEU75556.1 CRISPR-associated protein Cas2 [Mycoplasmopsis maculosa]